MRELDLLLQLDRHVGFFALSYAFEQIRFAIGKIDVTVERIGGTDRPLLGNDVTSVRRLQRVERAGKICARSIHFVDEEQMRQLTRLDVFHEYLRLRYA